MDFKLELVMLPVTDVDRARDFYAEKCGFHLDLDDTPVPDIRIVQLTPPGSGCSIAFGTGFITTPPGSVQGLHLVVKDIHAARASVVERGLEIDEVVEMGAPGKSTVLYAAFTDPDGNGWTLQQLPY